MLLIATKTLYIVLIVYCNVNHEQCGLAAGNTTYKTLAACTKVAKTIDKNTLEEILGGTSSIPPPWDASVKCGTQKQAAETEAALRKWSMLNQQRATQPEHEEHPGDRDPAPDGS